MTYDDEVWPTVPDNDLWVFDKLILSRKLGHTCGPAGVAVPRPDWYVVRPCVNLNGLGLGSYITHIEDDTYHLPVGTFWQEVFCGDHLSVDYLNGDHLRTTQGWKQEGSTSRFTRWCITDQQPGLPDLVQDLVTRYTRVNVEMIGGSVIEVHLRGNPDFDDGACECIPVWSNEKIDCPPGFVYIEDTSGDRLGFYKRYLRP